MNGIKAASDLEASATALARQLDWDALSAEEASEVVAVLQSAARIIQAAGADGCAAVTRKRTRAGVTTGSAAAELGELLGVPSGQVRRRAEAGARRGTRAGRAAAGGEIAPEQEREIAKAVERLPEKLDEAEKAAFEDTLINKARDGAWRDSLTTASRAMLYKLAPEKAVADEAEQARRREMRVCPADQQGMSEIGISADPVLRALVDATLATYGQPGHLMPEEPGASGAQGDPRSDTRSPGQRAHDALCHVLRMGLESQDAGPKGVATIVVSVTPEQLDAMLTDERGTAGAAELVETNGGTTMSVRQAVGLAGGRSWFLSVLAENRQELHRIDVDTSPRRRLATALQRLVLYAAHGGCTFPGCARPAARCQAHHQHEYSRGGPTELWNLALLCPTHHGWTGTTEHQWRTVPGRAHPGMPRWIPPRTKADKAAGKEAGRAAGRAAAGSDAA